MKKAVISLALVAVLLLAGFIAIPVDSFGSNSGASATETVIDIPEDISYIADIKTMPDGSVVLTGGNQHEKTLIKYVSKNQGETWQKECEYLSQLPLDMSEAEAVEGFGYVSDDEYVAISVCTYKKDIHYMTSENEDEMGSELHAYIIKPNGDIREVEQPTTEEYGGYFEAYFSGDRLYFDDVRGNMYEVDRESGKLIGRVMEDTNVLGAELVINDDSLQVVTEDEMGYPCGTPFPRWVDTETWQTSEDWQVYTFAADVVKDRAGTYYVADMEGISLYSEEDGRTLIHKNNRAGIDHYSDFYDLTSVDANTILVHSWNEKTGVTSVIKYNF